MPRVRAPSRWRSWVVVPCVLVAACNEAELPPPVPIFEPPALDASTASPSSSAIHPSSPPPVPGPSTVLRVTDLLVPNLAAGMYVVDAYAVVEGTRCPPCPPKVVCSPCPPSPWSLSDAPASGPRLPIVDQPQIAPGGRYRFRVEPPKAGYVGAAVHVVAVLARLALPPNGIEPYDGCDACLSHLVEWGQTTASGPTTKYAIEPCRGFRKTSAGRSPEVCTGRVACSPGLSPRIVEMELDVAEVKAAFARAPVVFGLDVRAEGRSVFRVAVDGREVIVGEPCGANLSCLQPPPGIAQLATQLSRGEVLTDDASCAAP